MDVRWSFFRMMTDSENQDINKITSTLLKLDTEPYMDTVETPGGDVNFMTWSPRHKAFLAGCDNGHVRKFDIDDDFSFNDEFQVPEGKNVRMLRISRSQKYLVVGLWNGLLKFYDYSDYEHQFNIDDFTEGFPRSISFSKNDMWCAVAFNQCKKVGLINTSRREVVDTLTLEKDFNCVTLSSTARYIITGDDDYDVRVYSREGMKLVKIMKGHEGLVQKIHYLFQTRQVVSCSNDYSLRIWDMTTFTCSGALFGHNTGVVNTEISKCEKYALSQDSNKEIRLWHLQNHECVLSILTNAEDIYGIGMHPNMDYIFIAEKGSQIRLWKLKENRPKPEKVYTIPNSENDTKFCSITFQPGTHNMISGSQCGKVLGLDLEENSRTFEISGHSDWIRSLHVDNVNNWIITCCDDKFIKIWDINTHEMLFQLEETDWIYDSIYSPSQQLLICSTRDVKLNAWDLKAREHNLAYTGHTKFVFSLAWLNAEQTQFVTGSFDRSVKVYDILKSEPIMEFLGHEAEVRKVIVNSTGSYIFSGADDRTIRMWNVEERNIECILSGHSDWIYDIVQTSDDKFLFSVSKDKTIRLWSVEEGICLAHIDCPVEMKKAYILDNDRILYFASLKSIYKFYNPLKVIAPSIYPETGEVYMFRNYVTKLLKDEPTGYDTAFNKFVIFPYRINIFHIAGIRLRVDDLKQAFRSGTLMISASTGDTPISLVLYRKSPHIAEILVKRLCKYIIPHQPRSLRAIETLLTTLNANGLPSLHRLYEKLFPFIERPGLQNFGVPRQALPIILADERDQVNAKDFLKTAAEKQPGDDEQPIEFRKSLLCLQLVPGSAESLQFLESLNVGSNLELYRTPLIKAILDYKLEQIRWIMIVQAIVFSLLVVTLTVHTLTDRNSLYTLITMIVLNTAFFVYEILQMFNGLLDYITDLWNMLDSLRITALYVYCITRILGYGDPFFFDVMLSLLTFLSWFRLVSYARMFDQMRYMIRMLIEIFKDMSAFLIILLMSTMAFSVIHFIADGRENFGNSILKSYRLDYGDFNDMDQNSMLKFVIFIFTTVINPLILLNMLIAIMGDTYDRVQESMVATDRREIVQMILEVEQVMFNKRRLGKAQYLSMCSEHGTGDENLQDVWEGKMRAIKKKMLSVESRCRDINNKMDIDQNRIDEMVKDLEKLTKDVEKLDQIFQTQLVFIIMSTVTPIYERNQDATIYVGNLDQRVHEELLWELFIQVGPVVNVHMPRDKVSNEHQGYGFIEFRGEEDADYAIKIMHMIKLYGRPIKVNKASQDKKSQDIGANIFVGNLDVEVDEKKLYETFSTFGSIVSARINRENISGKSQRYGFVSFDNFESSDNAIQAMNGQFLCNRPIQVSYAYKRDSKGERHGSMAERYLAANRPYVRPGMWNGAVQMQLPQMPPIPMAQAQGGARPPPPVLAPPPIPRQSVRIQDKVIKK